LRALYLVCSAVVCDYVGVSMMRVTLPFYAKALGGTGTLIGSIESAYGVGQVTGALILPRLSDSWGRRAILTMSCLGSALGYGTAICSRLLGSPALLLASRIPVGLAKQTVTVSRAVVADCTEPNEDRSKWMAFLGAALGVGCVVGPFLGGQSAERLGDIWPAVIATSIFAVLGPVVAVVLPETSPKAASNSVKDTGSAEGSKDAKPKLNETPLWKSPKVIAALAVLSLPELGLVAHASVTLYNFSMQRLGKGKIWIGNLTSISAIMQAAFSGGLLPLLSRSGWADVSVLHLGVWSFALASLIIAWGQSELAIMCSAPPAALANAVLRSFPASLLSKCAPEHRQGEVMGLLDLCSSGLRILAPILAGLMMDNLGEASVFVGQAGLFITASLGLIPLGHMMKKPADKTD